MLQHYNLILYENLRGGMMNFSQMNINGTDFDRKKCVEMTT